MAIGSQLVKFLLTAEDQTARGVASAESSITRLQNAASKLNSILGLVGVAFSADALINGLKDTADQMENVGVEAQKVGLSIDSWSALQYAAKLSDVAVESLSESINKLNKSMFEAAHDPEGSIARVFNALGVSVADAEGKLRSADQVIIDLASTFATLPDGPEKSALAMEVFGKSGADMIPLLNQGAEGIEKLRVEAERLGVVMSEDAVQAAGEFNDALDKMSESWRGLKIAATEWLLPVMNTWTTEVKRGADQTNQSRSAWDAFSNTWSALRDQIRKGIGLEPINKQIEQHQNSTKKVEQERSMPNYLRDLANASKEAEKAEKDRAAAAKYAAELDKADAQAVKAEIDVKRASITLAIEEQKTIYELAKARGQDASARDAKIKIMELEAEMSKLLAQAAQQEAVVALESAKAKLAEAKARGNGVELASAELEAAQSRLKAAELNLQIVDTQTKRTKELANITDKLTTSTSGSAFAMAGYAAAAGEATSQVEALAEMEERLMEIRDRANAARGQGGTTSWEYLLGKKGIELSTEQLSAFKQQIESIYEYLRGTFDGKVVSTTYLLDEAINKTLKLIDAPANTATAQNRTTLTRTTREETTTAGGSRGGVSLTINVTGPTDANALARLLVPEIDKINRLRS